MENYAHILSPYNRSEKILPTGKNLDDLEVKESVGITMPPCENIDFDWGVESIDEETMALYYKTSGFSENRYKNRLIQEAFFGFS